MSKVKDSKFYDEIYSNSAMYKQHYMKSVYWPLYQNIFKLIPTNVYNKPLKILDVGCGTGQFGQYLQDMNLTNYLGIDFSETSIGIAKTLSKQNFLNCSYEDFSFESFNVVIALEVLEHLENDFSIIEKLSKETLFIFSVPSYDSKSHVRYFNDPYSVKARYSKILDIRILRIMTLNDCYSQIFYGRGYKR